MFGKFVGIKGESVCDASLQVCLPARGTSQATGKKCTVTGYGYMGESKSPWALVIGELVWRYHWALVTEWYQGIISTGYGTLVTGHGR